MGSISIREFIRWLPHPPSEPTSTIVVTSLQKTFVDLRIERATGSKGEVVLLSFSRPGACINTWVLPKDIIPDSSRLSWGIAGRSTSGKPERDAEGRSFHHSVWEHWIDSHTKNPEDATDEGDMYPLGDDSVLEKGAMVNPDTGKVTDYEELWRDVSPAPTNGSNVADTVVLLLDDDTHQERGLVVRVGQYCQGLMRSGDSITAERWDWSRADGWQRRERLGSGFLPCASAIDGPEKDRLEVGKEMKYEGQTWIVTELNGTE